MIYVLPLSVKAKAAVSLMTRCVRPMEEVRWSVLAAEEE
jgi:hypothetical protein